jgi:hypothetical protein
MTRRTDSQSPGEETSRIEPLPEPGEEPGQSRLGIISLALAALAIALGSAAIWRIGLTERAWRDISRRSEALWEMVAMLTPTMVLAIAGLTLAITSLLRGRARRARAVLAALLHSSVLIAALGVIAMAYAFDMIF